MATKVVKAELHSIHQTIYELTHQATPWGSAGPNSTGR